jgi:hypothetical protein
LPTPVSALLHAATYAISSFKILSKAKTALSSIVENTPPRFLSNNVIKLKLKKNKLIETQEILI